MKKTFPFIYFIFIVSFNISCGMNQGFDSPNGDFYSQGETESKIGFAVSLKLASLNINSFTFLPYQFPQDPNCKRQSFYKKKSVRECMNIILVTDFRSNDVSDFFGKVGVVIREVCNLERQIFFDNSFAGEINFCSVKF